MCWKWGVIHEGTWTIFRVPDRIHGWQGHPWYHELLCLTPRKIPWKFGVYIFIKSESRWGVINGGTCMMLTVPDRRLGGQGHSWCHAGHCLTQRKMPWNICIYIFIRSVSRIGGCFQEILGGFWGFLTGYLVGRVILDIMDYFIWPQGRQLGSLVSISLLELIQEWGVLNGGTWRMLRVPDRRLGEQGYPWCHWRPCLTKTKITWKFCVDIFIKSMSRIGGPSWGYFEDVEGS